MAKKMESRGGATPAVKSVAQPADVAAGTQTGPGSSPLEDPEARGDARAATTSPLASSTKPNAVEVRGADGRFQQGSTHQRGPDRKPRQVSRTMLLRALTARQQKNGGPPVSGAEDQTLSLRAIMGDRSRENRAHVLHLQELIKETFDDAPDAGSGRTTRFIYASELEAERKAAAAGQQPSGDPQKPAAPAGPLAGMEEVEEPDA